MINIIYTFSKHYRTDYHRKQTIFQQVPLEVGKVIVGQEDVIQFNHHMQFCAKDIFF